MRNIRLFVEYSTEVTVIRALIIRWFTWLRSTIFQNFCSTESMRVNLKAIFSRERFGDEDDVEMRVGRRQVGGLASFGQGCKFAVRQQTQAEALMYDKEKGVLKSLGFALKLGFARKLSQVEIEWLLSPTQHPTKKLRCEKPCDLFLTLIFLNVLAKNTGSDRIFGFSLVAFSLDALSHRHEIEEHEGQVVYLPHHGVTRKDSTSTPLRMMFNSFPVYDDHCLNEYWANRYFVQIQTDSCAQQLLAIYRKSITAFAFLSKPLCTIHRFLWRNWVQYLCNECSELWR